MVNNLKKGAVIGFLYGSGFLLIEDIIAWIFHQVDFIPKQIFISILLYPAVFASVGTLLAVVYNLLQKRKARDELKYQSFILIALCSIAIFFIGYREFSTQVIYIGGKMQILLVSAWGLMVFFVFFFLFKIFRRNVLALCAALTTLFILNVKIDYDPTLSEQLEPFIFGWRVATVAFAAGVFFIISGGKSFILKKQTSPFLFRKFLPLLLGTILIAGSSTSGALIYQKSTIRPQPGHNASENSPITNVILIIIDTLRADHMSLYGYERQTTPFIDEYSERGIIFENAMAPSSWTTPSMASMFSSRYAGMNGMDHWEDKLPNGLVTIAETLAEKGYFTKAISTNTQVSPYFCYDQGFADFLHLPGHGFKQLLFPYFIFSKPFSSFREFLYRIGFLDANTEYGSAKNVNEWIIPWLEQNHTSRYFLYLHYMEPHWPYYPTETEYSTGKRFTREDLKLFHRFFYLDKTTEDVSHFKNTLTDRYDDEIRRIDHRIGELFQAFDKNHVWDNSLVILTSDHGEELVDHGLYNHGHTMYQELLHVPLVLFFPDGLNAGMRIEDHVDLLDIAPTVHEYLGIPSTEHLEGVSLIPLIQGDSKRYRTAKRDYFGEVFVFRKEGHLNRIYALMNGNYKLILDRSEEPREIRDQITLFDLDSESTEIRNLAELLPDITHTMLAQMDTCIAYCEPRKIQDEESSDEKPDEQLIERMRGLGYVK